MNQTTQRQPVPDNGIMTIVSAWIEGHPVLSYYALTFALSWGALIIVAGPGLFTGTTQLSALSPLVYVAMLVGPSVAGLLLTRVIPGRAVFRGLSSRMIRGRVSVGWYALALVTAPFLMSSILLAFSLASPEFPPAILKTGDRANLLLTGVVMGLAVGTCEEVGWMGFAAPRLLRRYGVITTGLVMGLLWGLWHFPLFLGPALSTEGVPPIIMLAVFLFSFLPVYRLLMVWAYDRTESILLSVLMHAPLAASQLILIPAAVTESGPAGVAFNLTFAAALWGVVLSFVVANRSKASTPVGLSSSFAPKPWPKPGSSSRSGAHA